MNYDELMAMLNGVEFENRDDFVKGMNSLSAGAQARITELETDNAQLAADFVTGMNSLSAGAQARITELETANAQLAADLQEAQANNYKLIMAQTGISKPEEPEGTEEVTEEDKDVTKLIKD